MGHRQGQRNDGADWERDDKAAAHARWTEVLSADRYRALMKAGDFGAIARLAVTIESRTNLLFSFEKMALRDAVRSPEGARAYGFDFQYVSRPNRATCESLLAFAEQVRRDQIALAPRDMIDLQSFICVQGSDEYDE